MDGQAQAPESDGIDSLADFLADTPIKESENEELAADELPLKDNDSEAEPQTEEAEAEEESQDESEEEAKPTTEEVEVTVKSEDGSDTKIKVTKDELIKGYQRQADYTRKTQGLVERENQAVQVFHQKHSELRNDYLQHAEFATQAIAQLAGFRSEAEMGQLAAQDPAQWVQENQRQNQIKQILGTLEQQTQAERMNAAQQSQQWNESQLKMVKERSWVELQKDGFDKPKLQKTYESVMKNYGYEPKDFANVTDYRLVRMMADATKYRELKSKAPAVTQQAKAAPRVQSKQTAAIGERQAQAINSKFETGRAKRQDLAAFMRNL
jgi:hypothetical protein